MNLTQWLQKIEAIHPRSIDLGLDRIAKVAANLNLQAFQPFVISVAGTNGKGSTVAMLEAILLAEGYKVGAYYSPHLIRFNERIHIHGQEVTDEILCQAFAMVEKARKDISLSFFEFTTLAALYLFNESKLDVTLLEVGLGGRLDAVNVLDPDIAVITSIGIDHIDWLGDTREAIAFEKAGILRQHKPCVCGDEDPPQSLLKEVLKLEVPFYCLGKNFNYKSNPWYWWNETKMLENLVKPKFYLQNAATVLQVISLLPVTLNVTLSNINQGLLKANLIGRYQKIEGEVLQILDVAHNEHAAKRLAQQLNNDPIAGKNYAVFSMLKDKNIMETIKALQNNVVHWHIAKIDSKRGASMEQLQQAFRDLNMTNITEYATLKQALSGAIKHAHHNDRIVAWGSIYTVAELVT